MFRDLTSVDLSRFEPPPIDAPPATRPVHRWPQWWWRRLELSANTHRSFGHQPPRTRGWLHLAGAVGWPFVVAWLLTRTTSGTEVVGVLVFGLSMQAMLTASAVTHLRRWGVWTTELLFRLDHTGIFLAIAGTITPIALLTLDGWARPFVVTLAWVIAVTGTAVALHPRSTPVGFGNGAFIGAGTIILPFVPSMVGDVPTPGLVLLGTGAATYVVGAILLAFQRPRLSPAVFGYHEVWHTMVALGMIQHLVMLDRYLLPLA